MWSKFISFGNSKNIRGYALTTFELRLVDMIGAIVRHAGGNAFENTPFIIHLIFCIRNEARDSANFHKWFEFSLINLFFRLTTQYDKSFHSQILIQFKFHSQMNWFILSLSNAISWTLVGLFGLRFFPSKDNWAYIWKPIKEFKYVI